MEKTSHVLRKTEAGHRDRLCFQWQTEVIFNLNHPNTLLIWDFTPDHWSSVSVIRVWYKYYTMCRTMWRRSHLSDFNLSYSLLALLKKRKNNNYILRPMFFCCLTVHQPNIQHRCYKTATRKTQTFLTLDFHCLCWILSYPGNNNKKVNCLAALKKKKIGLQSFGDRIISSTFPQKYGKWKPISPVEKLNYPENLEPITSLLLARATPPCDPTDQPNFYILFHLVGMVTWRRTNVYLC